MYLYQIECILQDSTLVHVCVCVGGGGKEWKMVISLNIDYSAERSLYLNSVGKCGAHAVAGRHGLRQSLGALELRIDDLKTANTRLHYHTCRESLQTLHFIIKVTVSGYNLRF